MSSWPRLCLEAASEIVIATLISPDNLEALLNTQISVGCRHEEESEIVGRYGEAVHHVHGPLQEGRLVRSPRQPDQELQGEVADTEGLEYGSKLELQTIHRF